MEITIYIANERLSGVNLLTLGGSFKVSASGRLYTNKGGLWGIGNHLDMKYNPETGEIGYDNSSRKDKINIEPLEDDWHGL